MELMARAGDKKKFPSISLLIVFTVNPRSNVETMSFSRVLIRRASLAEIKNGEANHWLSSGREGRNLSADDNDNDEEYPFGGFSAI